MNWNEIKKNANWKPLQMYSGSGEHINEDLYKIHENLYLFLVPYNRELVETDEAPYISLIIWGQSEGAVRRAYCQEIENDNLQHESVPPNEMLLPTGSRTYREILQDAKTKNFGPWMENSTYRLVSDGKFIHKTIEVGNFHFRNNEDDPNEMPYVISYKEG